ncbi:cytochrome P450 [Neohortaea acidophila]|uniref:Cytochrome P450 n=1 Tax=Neohortaea acidophila TaxID=245834 RepID=A0A6A6PP57_9PEZI|nr:cytochrome P450 [Neohortaea acidophila]KAF2481414.1 cytochrome P450 [Neohortaea acidophila]
MEYEQPAVQRTPQSSHSFRYYAVLPIFIFLIYKTTRLAVFTYHTRKRYRDIPSLPRHWLLGNLIAIGRKCSPQLNRHPDYGFSEIWHDLGQPAAFHIDLAPVDSHGFLIVADPAVADTVVQSSSEYPFSAPKSDTMRQSLNRLLGEETLIMAEGEVWRDLRKRFNKGFAPAHLHALCPFIVAQTRTFIARIQDAARSGQTFALKDFAQDLTTDVITQLTMEKDFKAQSVADGTGSKSTFGVLTASRILSKLVATTGQGFDPIGYLNPVRRIKERFYEWSFDRQLYSVLSLKLQREQTHPKKADSSAKAIVQLALADLDPTPALLRNTVHQIKSFLFAGQDTTSTLIQYLAYELSKADHDPRYREIVSSLEDEHERVFGPGAYSALDVLSQPGKADELLGDKIPKSTAFVKETLRLHPPAATARGIPEASSSTPPFFIDIDGRRTAIDGLRVYNCQWIMHRNPKVWGADAHVFNPARWLDEAYISALPPGAFRPFERGPRNCIGQELAMMEAKLVLCAVTRGLRFEKVGLTGRNGEREVWGTQHVTTVPVDGMKMRFHLRDESEVK